MIHELSVMEHVLVIYKVIHGCTCVSKFIRRTLNCINVEVCAMWVRMSVFKLIFVYILGMQSFYWSFFYQFENQPIIDFNPWTIVLISCIWIRYKIWTNGETLFWDGSSDKLNNFESFYFAELYKKILSLHLA